MRGTTVVFDLDGTLVDTAPDLIDAVNHTLERLGIAGVGDEVLRPVISHGSRVMIETALAHRGRRLPPADIDPMFEQLLVYYAANIAVRSRPFERMPTVLAGLAREGATLAVCTNKREGLARQLLDELGLATLFKAITGRDTFPVCKPHPDHLLGTIAQAGGDPARSVMVGDSDTDITTAKAARVPVVAVTFGYTEKPVVTCGPDALIDHYDALPAALRRLLGLTLAP